MMNRLQPADHFSRTRRSLYGIYVCTRTEEATYEYTISGRNRSISPPDTSRLGARLGLVRLESSPSLLIQF